jgi:hypothetical protein
MAAKRLSRLAGTFLALIAATAAWFTGGALTFTSSSAGASRIGVLPPLFWPAIALAVALAAVHTSRRHSVKSLLLALLAVSLAPWLPGSLPAALFIWAGPLRFWLWTIVLAGLFAPAVIRRAPSILTTVARDPRRAPWLAAALAAIAYLGAAWQVFPRLPTGDEPHYLVIAQSLLADHDLKIENNHRRGDYHAYYGGDLRPDYLRRGTNGEIYSVHAPGLAVIVAPVFAMFGYPGVLVFLALVSAAGTALAWTATWRVTTDTGAAWFGWAAAALSAPFLFQSFVVYPDAPGAVLVMVGVLALVADGPLSATRLVLTGAALALLPWLHTRYVAAAVMLGLAIAARARAARRIAALLSIPAVSAACWFAFFYVIYGTPDPRAPYGGSTQSDIANLGRGLTGLLFDQQFGMLPAAPVLLCALAGFVVLVRKSPSLAAALAAIAAPYGLVVGAYQMWWGGNSSPGRFLVPIVLPLAIPAGVWFHTRRGSASRLAGFGALAISLLISATLAFVDRGVLLYNFRDGSSRLLTWLSPLVNVTTGLPSVFQTTPAAAFAHGLVWLAAIAIAVAAAMAIERRKAAPVTVAVVLGFTAVAASAAALSIVWWDHGVAVRGSPGPDSPVTPSRATAALLYRFDPDARGIAVSYHPLHRVRARDVLPQLTLAATSSVPETRDVADLALFDLPGGTYRIAGTGATKGPLAVSVDNEFGPQWTWALDGAAESWQRDVRLPVSVRSLIVRAPGARGLVVRPLEILRSAPAPAGPPQQVARSGPAVLFLVAGDAFMEREGAWVAGGKSADVVISPDEGAAPRLLVRNPPVANTIVLQGEGWHQYLMLAPGEEREVTLPFAQPPTPLRLRVSAAQGARPSEFERGSSDTRFLGCWIETRS